MSILKRCGTFTVRFRSETDPGVFADVGQRPLLFLALSGAAHALHPVPCTREHTVLSKTFPQKTEEPSKIDALKDAQA